MDTKQIILSGIYDKRTLEHSLSLGITKFSFDFRPMSVNFIQQYVFEDLLKVLSSDLNPSRFTVYLRFQFEKDFMIENILSSIRGLGIDYILQLKADEDVGYYQKLDSKISFCYDQDLSLKHVKSSGYLDSLTLNYGFLDDIASDNRLDGFVSNLSARGAYSMPHIIDLDWDSQVSKVVLDYFNCELFVLSINGDVEVCYRNVDLNKLDTRLKFLSI